MSSDFNLDDFKYLYRKAGFKNKAALGKFLEKTHSTINSWGSVTPFPSYIKPLLEALIKAKKYDELVAKGIIKE